jgi:hypothetical protein
MAELLTKAILNTITNTLYPGVTAAFHSLSPTAGETLIVTLTEGFTFAREREVSRESAVKMWIAADANITPAQIKIAGVVVITANGQTTRYALIKLLTLQQVGAGYMLRLTPQKGVGG